MAFLNDPIGFVRRESSAWAPLIWHRKNVNERIWFSPGRFRYAQIWPQHLVVAHDTWSGNGSSSDKRTHRPNLRNWILCRRLRDNVASDWKREILYIQFELVNFESSSQFLQTLIAQYVPILLLKRWESYALHWTRFVATAIWVALLLLLTVAVLLLGRFHHNRGASRRTAACAIMMRH